MAQSLLFRACPLCECKNAAPWLHKGDLHLVRCNGCSMIYADPVPASFASGEYYDAAGTEFYLSPAKLESDYAEVRFERELRLFRKHCAKGAVLDVGCSSGAFLFQLNKRFSGAYGILGNDVSGAPLDYAESRGVPVVRGNFLECELPSEGFDAITFWAVLEHLIEPRRSLQKAWALLKPGGLCFVLVPNMRSLAVRVLGANYRYIYPQHLNYFTKATLLKLTADQFTPVDFRSTHFNPIVIWEDLRSGGAEISNAERARLLERTTAYKRNPMLKPVKLLYQSAEKALAVVALADNLAVVLRKKQAPTRN